MATSRRSLRVTSGNTFGEYVKGAALDRELRFLRDYGFIEMPSITQIPEEGPELSRHVFATETGKSFVELRERLIGDS
jgi:hypothetical protein